MIRINLLPVTPKGTVTVQTHLMIGAAALIATIVGCLIWTTLVNSEEKERREIIAQKQKDLAQLEKIIGEVNAFTEKKKELEEKLKIIDSLRKGKTGPVRALDDLATEIPNRVWLTKVTESSGSVIIEGNAIDNEDVSEFMKSLEKSKYFTGIALGFSKAKTVQGSTLYEFKITCRVDYSA